MVAYFTIFSEADISCFCFPKERNAYGIWRGASPRTGCMKWLHLCVLLPERRRPSRPCPASHRVAGCSQGRRAPSRRASSAGYAALSSLAASQGPGRASRCGPPSITDPRFLSQSGQMALQCLGELFHRTQFLLGELTRFSKWDLAWSEGRFAPVNFSESRQQQR